ncbi:MAG: hypothetical protein LBU73_10070 [Helicobacteraceae bacterium]|jgi:dolichyl-diphosphooligosaccharide--protein glycosyltransferase/undecaprenyl-diphosphooligosaccharide--protein glycosyltransferase|nr:hypothetical protein [Helicobacteraceae bacterium]
MRSLQKFFTIDFSGEKSSPLILAALVLLAIVFGFVCRLYFLWVFNASEYGYMYWNGELMINTNDGYFWAEGARDRVENPPFADELSPMSRALPVITAAIARILPVSFETLILFMPAIFAPLLAIPVLLAARLAAGNAAGFAAALISVIAWSYYNRTLIGYYDDDMLTIVLPMLAFYALLAGAITKKPIYLLLVAIFAPLSVWYYPNSILIIFACAGILTLFAALEYKEDKSVFLFSLISFMFLGFISYNILTVFLGNFGLITSFVFSVVFYILYLRSAKLKESVKIALILFVVLAIAALYFSNIFSHFWHQVSTYIVRDVTDAIGSDQTQLRFFNVAQTVREAGKIPFEEFANRISGHQATFVLAIIGAVIMFIAKPITLISLPFLLMGFMAYGIPMFGIKGGGLRFTIYAVPIMAISLAYIIFWLNNRVISKFEFNNNFVHALFFKYKILAFLAIFICLLPHFIHIKEYLTPTVFYDMEVRALDNLKEKIEKRKDYAVTWWDYGFPIRYYSYAKTLADGAKHSGSDNFAPSFILTTESQRAAVNLSRIAVEYTEKQIADKNYSSGIVAMAMKDYNHSDPNKFIKTLSEELILPEKTREIYLVLPRKMNEIFTTVMAFSTLDLKTGRRISEPFFSAGKIANNDGAIITLNNGIKIDTERGVIRMGQHNIPIKYEFFTGYNENGEFFRRSQTRDLSAPLSIIFTQNTGDLIILDDRALNSVFVKLFALENYDDELFEKVIANPYIKIYKAKL